MLTFTQTQQFTAQGPGSGSVNWSVDGVAGGSAAVGNDHDQRPVHAAERRRHTHRDGHHRVSRAVSATVYVTNYAGTFTFHNDNMRTGENLNETVLDAGERQLIDLR